MKLFSLLEILMPVKSHQR